MTTSGSGVIDVSGGTLNVGGTVTPEVFTNFTRTGGTVNLLGVLTNTGNTFTFNATTGTWNLAGGTVVGGTIAFADGQTLAISTSFNNRLTGVTITGDLVMNIAGAVLRISGGLTVNGGAIRLTGDATTLAYEGTQTWSTGAVFFEGSTGGRRIIEAVNGGTTLTLGASFTVHGSGDLGGSRLFGNTFTLLNSGTIKADVSGQSLDIPSRVTLTNVTATGKLRLDPVRH